MITQEQIKSLSQTFQIDSFTIIREYLQLIFLDYFFQEKEAEKIFFKGGTAIRLFFGSPRFSEDLDFSTLYSKRKIRKIIESTKQKIQREIPSLKVIPLYSGKETKRFRIKYHEERLKYPLTIRLDFHQVRKIGETTVSALSTKFPIVIFPLIPHLTARELLGEKVRALLSRGKGRDFFDVWYLLERGVQLPKKIEKSKILKKIERVSSVSLERDLASFLPRSQRRIVKSLKERLKGYFVSETS